MAEAADETYDVVVVGSGNAGFSAAASAKEHGAAKVLLLEKAPEGWAGGNTTFTAGAYRTVFDGLADVLPLVDNAGPDVAGRIDMDAYTEQDFLADLERVTGGRTQPALARALVGGSRDTTSWLARNGVRFQLSFHRQAYEIDGRFRFWGGMVLCVRDGGKGLTQQHRANAARLGVDVRFDAPVTSLLADTGGRVCGVTTRRADGSPLRVAARGGVVLCAGGFEADAAMRAQHLGAGWERAHVRGTPHNSGDALRMALALGARPAGDWAGCHSTCWDANAPRAAGDQELTNQFTKSGYPLGLMVNAAGARFVDEGVDMRNYTYARFGREILHQPGGVAFQLWDADGAAWLRGEEYAAAVVERVEADTVEALAAQLAARGLDDPQALVRTVNAYNAAVWAHRAEHPDVRFDPSKKDGLSTRCAAGGLALDKTNWALPLAKPPFLAVKVACGITFTFGGLQIDPDSAAVVADTTGLPIPGLFCAGEMVGGLFYGNYPGGSGLTAGAVFGRRAGRAAAEGAVR